MGEAASNAPEPEDSKARGQPNLYWLLIQRNVPCRRSRFQSALRLFTAQVLREASLFLSNGLSRHRQVRTGGKGSRHRPCPASLVQFDFCR